MPAPRASVPSALQQSVSRSRRHLLAFRGWARGLSLGDQLAREAYAPTTDLSNQQCQSKEASLQQRVKFGIFYLQEEFQVRGKRSRWGWVEEVSG